MPTEKRPLEKTGTSKTTRKAVTREGAPRKTAPRKTTARQPRKKADQTAAIAPATAVQEQLWLRRHCRRSTALPTCTSADFEAQWEQRWEADELYKTSPADERPKMYVLDFYPYPSGDA